MARFNRIDYTPEGAALRNIAALQAYNELHPYPVHEITQLMSDGMFEIHAKTAARKNPIDRTVGEQHLVALWITCAEVERDMSNLRGGSGH